jgi:hypothetical protein
VATIVVGVLVVVAVGLVVSFLDDGSETTSAAQGSGVTATETRELPAFSAIDLAGVNDVIVGIGGEQRVVVLGDDNLIELVTTEVEGGTLVIAQSQAFEAASPMRVEITVPSLDDVRLSGSGAVSIDGHDIELFAVSMSGTGVIRGSGTAGRLDVELGGTGDIELESLAAESATVELSGAGNVHVHVTGSLDARVSGTGTIFYTGSPSNVSSEVTGAGAVIEK